MHATFIDKWSFKMVFEHLWNYFHLENSTNGFPQLFQLCFHFAQGHIPPRITRVLRVAYLLAMIKLLGGVCPIIVGETLYRLTSHILCFQFHNIFITHFPHTNLELPLKEVMK
jgi:hypothetical protein